MIYPKQPDPAPTPLPSNYSTDSGDELRLRDLIESLARHRWLVAGVAGFVICAAGLLIWLQKPVYESTTSIRIDAESGRLNPLAEALPGSGMGRGILETEMIVLQSRQIAESVVDSLALTVRLIEPRAPRDAFVKVNRTAPDAVPGILQLRRNGDGTYTPSAARGLEGVTMPESVEPGRLFGIGGLQLAIRPAAEREAPDHLTLEVLPYRRVVEDLRKALRVARMNRDAQVLSVSYRDTDAWLAAAVPNAAAQSFIHYKTDVTKAESKSTVAFLREQVASYEVQLEESETGLRGFREQAQVVDLAAEASEQVRRLAELQARRDEMQAERDALSRLLVRASQPSVRDDEPSPYRQLASYPVFLSNRAIQDLLQSLTLLENQRAQLLIRRTAENVDVRGIDTRIREIEGQLFQTAQSYLESVESQLGSLNATLARFGTELERIPAREVQFARLSRQSELLEQIYTLLQTRLKEAEIREAIEPTEVRVIDPAIVAERPVAPRPLRTMALAVVLGLMIGVGAAFGRQALDTKVRTREDAEAATGGMPVLGLIPRIRPDGRSTPGDASSTGGRPPRIRVGRLVGTLEPQFEERLVTRRDPRSPTAEAYRALRTNITFASVERAPQVLVVTSAMPGDGKSTSSSNLAITLAQQGTRALLIDGDLRRGLLHRVFEKRQEPGLTNVLLGHASVDEAIQHIDVADGVEPLHFLATGVLPPNPAELVGSDRMRALIQRLREGYDAIVIDAPPLNLVTDAALLGTMADTTILVTRAGVTERGALQHAAGQLHHLRAPIGGIVLNCVDAGNGSYYGGHEYYGEYPRNGKAARS